VTIQWSGGFESVHAANRPVHRHRQLDGYDELIGIALQMALAGKRSSEIATRLNELGYLTPRNQSPYSASMVGKMLQQNKDANRQLHRPHLHQDQWLAKTLAAELNMPVKRLKDWVTRGWAHAIQRPFGRTWVIWADETELTRLKQLHARQAGKTTSNPPAALIQTGFHSRAKS
jgi:hypothetical protein